MVSVDSLPADRKRVNGQPPLTEAGQKLRSFYPSPEERKVYYAARKIPLRDRVALTRGVQFDRTSA
ncbi:MAG: hypothetical protein ICV80_10925 [Microcoleus sp. T1-bin1]|nr:hypothetical protein [Microcoleus sp. T1-bin1]